MTDLTIPTFLKRSKTPKTVDTPLSNVPSTPQDPKKSPKVVTNFKQPRKAKAPVKDNVPPKQTAPAKRAKSKVADFAEAKLKKAGAKETPGSKAFSKAMAEMKQKPTKEPVIQKTVKLDPEAVETAKAGHLPVPPEVTDKSSAAFKRILGDLIALAKNKDRAGLALYNLTDRMALRRYRDLCVIALGSK